MSRYNDLPFITTPKEVIDFIETSSIGDAVEYACPLDYDENENEMDCKHLAWAEACNSGKITLFKRRIGKRFQSIIVRISPITSKRLGLPILRMREQ